MTQLAIIDQTTENWQRVCRLVNFLLREGAELRWATESFRAIRADGTAKELRAGSFLVTGMTLGTELTLNAALQRYGVDLEPIASVAGFAGHRLYAPRIALYGGGGAPFNHARIFAELGFDVEFISPQELRAGALAAYDIFVIPGGGGQAMIGQLAPLGDEGCRAIKRWVQEGGMYVGSCAGSFDAAIVADSFVQACPQQRHLQMVNAMVWNRSDTEWMGLASPGIGVIESRVLQADHPVMFGLPERFPITHYNGPLFEPATDALADASAVQALTAVDGAAADFTPSELFLRCSESRDQAHTLLGRAAAESRSNIVSGYNGLGRVVLFGSHPEFGYNLAMDAWDLPARMLANAAFWQAGHMGEARPRQIKRAAGVAHAYPPGSGLGRIGEACGAITDALEQLAGCDNGSIGFLAEDHAMSMFGLSGGEIWRRGLDDFADITARLQASVAQAERLLADATSLIDQDRALDSEDVATLREMVAAFEDALCYETPAAWGQDFGYEGILQMLGRVESMLRRAVENMETTFEPSDNPYAYFDSSPYQLVVGSYLAANGVYLNSWQLLRAHLLRIEEQLFAMTAVENI